MISPELKALFTEPYKESQIIDETFDKIRVEQGLKEAIEYLKSIGATKLDIKSYVINHHLDTFTKKSIPIEQRIALLKSLKDDKEVFDVKVEYDEEKERHEITLDTIEGQMHAIPFSEICPQLLEVLPELENDGRIGECFRLAYDIMRHIKNPCQMVTGYVFGYTDLSKFLHSWLEVKFRGKTYVIDGTNNLLIDKNAYYIIRHAIPITKISKKTFRRDLRLHKDLYEGMNLPVYLLYRHDIMAGIEPSATKFEVQDIFTKR